MKAINATGYERAYRILGIMVIVADLMLTFIGSYLIIVTLKQLSLGIALAASLAYMLTTVVFGARFYRWLSLRSKLIEVLRSVCGPQLSIIEYGREAVCRLDDRSHVCYDLVYDRLYLVTIEAVKKNVSYNGLAGFSCAAPLRGSSDSASGYEAKFSGELALKSEEGGNIDLVEGEMTVYNITLGEGFEDTLKELISSGLGAERG